MIALDNSLEDGVIVAMKLDEVVAVGGALVMAAVVAGCSVPRPQRSRHSHSIWLGEAAAQSKPVSRGAFLPSC